jgi:FlaA1/EpsC-like NDP-sugar epimerase
VDIVVHAAAMKRLETCEREPQEAVKTNVVGSINVINACLETGVAHAIALSSDKAVYPVNTYGKTKALMESVWIQSNAGLGQEHLTKFSIVRYGNVLGSRGSVVDIFRKQAEEGVMKITNPIMTRFFMPVAYATELVAFAIENQQGGEIYVPVLKATSIAALAGVIGKGKRAEITGPRPGEKVHEDLITEKEMAFSSMTKGIVTIDPEYCIWPYSFAERKPFEFNSRSCDAKKLTDTEINELISVAHKARTGV